MHMRKEILKNYAYAERRERPVKMDQGGFMLNNKRQGFFPECVFVAAGGKITMMKRYPTTRGRFD